MPKCQADIDYLKYMLDVAQRGEIRIVTGSRENLEREYAEGNEVIFIVLDKLKEDENDDQDK